MILNSGLVTQAMSAVGGGDDIISVYEAQTAIADIAICEGYSMRVVRMPDSMQCGTQETATAIYDYNSGRYTDVYLSARNTFGRIMQMGVYCGDTLLYLDALNPISSEQQQWYMTATIPRYLHAVNTYSIVYDYDNYTITNQGTSIDVYIPVTNTTHAITYDADGNITSDTTTSSSGQRPYTINCAGWVYTRHIGNNLLAAMEQLRQAIWVDYQSQ